SNVTFHTTINLYRICQNATVAAVVSDKFTFSQLVTGPSLQSGPNAPNVSLLWPTVGSTLNDTDPLVLRASAEDPEDGLASGTPNDSSGLTFTWSIAGCTFSPALTGTNVVLQPTTPPACWETPGTHTVT